MKIKKFARLAFATLLSISALSAHASIVTLTTEQSKFGQSLNQGWWSPDVVNETLNDNHFTGTFIVADNSRSFYTFDMRNVHGTITSATLHVMRALQSPAVNLELWDVSTPADVLNNNVSTNLDIFDDIGSGNSYGNYVIVDGGFYDYLNLSLNSQALSDLNKNSGFFSIGARVPDADQYIFSATIGDVTSLVLNVQDAPQSTDLPEPTSLAILLAGVGSIAVARRRKA